MKKPQLTEEQITFALKYAETGTSVRAGLPQDWHLAGHAVTPWRKKFAELGISELRRLRQLDDENRKLKQLMADLSWDKAMLQNSRPRGVKRACLCRFIRGF